MTEFYPFDEYGFLCGITDAIYDLEHNPGKISADGYGKLIEKYVTQSKYIPPDVEKSFWFAYGALWNFTRKSKAGGLGKYHLKLYIPGVGP